MPSHENILDRRMLSLSDADHLHLRDLVEGTLITGAPGSGKTTTSGRQLAHAFLKTPKMGGLVLTAKAEETANWLSYVKACGREKDLILFNADSGLCFDPLHYEWTRPGRGAGDLETIVDFFSTLISIGKKEVGHGHDPFWERGSEQSTRHSTVLVDLAGEPLSIVSINNVIASLPVRPGQQEEPKWQKQSYCAQLLKSIDDRADSLSRNNGAIFKSPSSMPWRNGPILTSVRALRWK